MSSAAVQLSNHSLGVSGLRLTPLGKYRGLRALAWDGNDLYLSRGYELVKARFGESGMMWERQARFCPSWWRDLSVRFRLPCRLARDGFHALAVLPSGDLIAALPGAIARLAPGENEFSVRHRILRGTRPLHIVSTPSGMVFWGEYFDNGSRDEVHIYGSMDRGANWEPVYTFPERQVRHVHNLVYDQWDDCIWILTGDDGEECRILRASCDFKNVDVLVRGNQQARAVALLVTKNALYFSSDTPLERNHIYRFDRRGGLTVVGDLSSSSISGCKVGQSTWFSGMAEPSEVNEENCVTLYGSANGAQWNPCAQWKKDFWPMRLFQYGNAFLPDGENATDVLAVTTLGVNHDDLTTTCWRVSVDE